MGKPQRVSHEASLTARRRVILKDTRNGQDVPMEDLMGPHEG